MNPFNHALRIIQEMELKQQTNDFLPNHITDAVKNGDLEKINTFSLEQLNGTSNLYMGSGRPLIFDALSGFRSSQVLKLMIEKGVEINCVDTGLPNRSLLMQAVKFNSLEIIKIIVEAGADLKFRGNWDDGDCPQTIIGTALFNKRYEVVKYLKEQGAEYLSEEEEIIRNYHSDSRW